MRHFNQIQSDTKKLFPLYWFPNFPSPQQINTIANSVNLLAKNQEKLAPKLTKPFSSFPAKLTFLN